MGLSTWTGPGQFGDLFAGQTNGPNQGYVELTQSVQLTHNGSTAVTQQMYIPAGSQIVDFLIDNLTAWNSATSDTLSIGVAAAGTDYVSSVDVKTSTGRLAPTYTAAQLAAMSNQGVTGTASPTAATVNVTITPVGSASAGYTNVTMRYIQLVSNYI